MSGETWDGNDWEEYVHELLALLHQDKGDDYQRVPAEHGGDLGLDGFSRSTKTVYQCYAPQEPLSIRQRYEKQRDKITTDIAKFIKNEQDIVALLGNSVRIKNWTLVVPTHGSAELVEHATKKAAEVKSRKCHHVDNRRFQVLIKDKRAFPAQVAILANSGASRVMLSSPPDRALAQETLANAGAMVERATAKLRGRLNSGVDDLVQRLLLGHVMARNIEAEIGDDFPELARRIRDFNVAFEHKIETASILSIDGPRQRLRDILERYEEGLIKIVPNLSMEHTQILVQGKVGDLLERCPLSFPGTDV